VVVGEVRGAEAITLFQAMNTGHTFSTMHADSIETVINRLENEPINVPRAMVQSLDMLSIQTLTRSGDQRVRRAKTIGEIGGIDQRTGSSTTPRRSSGDAETDEFSRNDSSLMEEIADERGWSVGTASSRGPAPRALPRTAPPELASPTTTAHCPSTSTTPILNA